MRNQKWSERAIGRLFEDISQDEAERGECPPIWQLYEAVRARWSEIHSQHLAKCADCRHNLGIVFREHCPNTEWIERAVQRPDLAEADVIRTHAELCTNCQVVLDRVQFIHEGHPRAWELILHETGALPTAREREVAAHLAAGCPVCRDAAVRKLTEAVIHSGQNLLGMGQGLEPLVAGSIRNPIAAGIYASTQADESLVLARTDPGPIRAFVSNDPLEGEVTVSVTAQVSSPAGAMARVWVATRERVWQGDVQLSHDGEIWSGSTSLGSTSEWNRGVENMTVLVYLGKLL